MPSYVITGVSKGIGFEILRQLSTDPKNTVIGLVRDKATTEKKVADELPGRNIHIVSGDLENWQSLYKAAEETAKITGGSLDYLIANAGWPSLFDGFKPIGSLGPPEEVEQISMKLFKINCVGNIHLYQAFIPLIKKGEIKKVINISTGMADIEWINQWDIEPSPLYAMSKGAMNIVTAKFNAQYKKEGILFMGICPGMVDTGHYSNASPEELAGVQPFMAALAQYSPSFSGPREPELSVRDVIDVWERASFERGDGGAYVSHFGNKKWV